MPDSEQNSSVSEPSIKTPPTQNVQAYDESSLFPVTSRKLMSHNYLQYFQSVIMFNCGYGHEVYLTDVAI